NRRNQWVSLQGTACEAPRLLWRVNPPSPPRPSPKSGAGRISLYAAPVVKNPHRKAHKDPVTAEVCTL
ncbi:Hypothetical protein FKW44_011965, partial [Caligus rogercresseyi]